MANSGNLTGNRALLCVHQIISVTDLKERMAAFVCRKLEVKTCGEAIACQLDLLVILTLAREEGV